MKKLSLIMLFAALAPLHNTNADVTTQLNELKARLSKLENELGPKVPVYEDWEKYLSNTPILVNLSNNIDKQFKITTENIKNFMEAFDAFRKSSAMELAEDTEENFDTSVKPKYNEIKNQAFSDLLVQLKDYSGKKTEGDKEAVAELMENVSTLRNALATFINKQTEEPFYKKSDTLKNGYNAIIKETEDSNKKFEAFKKEVLKKWGITKSWWENWFGR
jgi:hypothetical protein